MAPKFSGWKPNYFLQNTCCRLLTHINTALTCQHLLRWFYALMAVFKVGKKWRRCWLVQLADKTASNPHPNRSWHCCGCFNFFLFKRRQPRNVCYTSVFCCKVDPKILTFFGSMIVWKLNHWNVFFNTQISISLSKNNNYRLLNNKAKERTVESQSQCLFKAKYLHINLKSSWLLHLRLIYLETILSSNSPAWLEPTSVTFSCNFFVYFSTVFKKCFQFLWTLSKFFHYLLLSPSIFFPLLWLQSCLAFPNCLRLTLHWSLCWTPRKPASGEAKFLQSLTQI